MDNSLTLPVDAFVRAVQVNKTTPHAVFLGAGASISSGVSPAYTCIWGWKRQIFLTNNVGLEEQFTDPTLPSVQGRIQQWLDAQGTHPPLDSPEEYGVFVGRCYPIPDDRRQFFQNLTATARPSLGYHLLCLLAQAGVVRSAWTTNFDGLVAKAAGGYNLAPIEVGLDTPNRTFRPPRDGELLCVSLHGDYRYDALKNTQSELQQQNEQLADAFIDYARNACLIVVGYSGRDESVMDMMSRAYSQPGAGRLYWCGHEQLEPDDRVRALIRTARAHHREAHYICASGFDDLMRRIALLCLSGEDLDKARALCARKAAQIESPPFQIPAWPVEAILRSNTFLIECPSELLQFKARGFNEPGAWARLRNLIAGKSIVAGLLKGNIIAFGTVDEVKEAFAEDIDGKIERSPIDEKELSMSNGVVISLLEEALTRSIALTHGLMGDGKNVIWKAERRCQQAVYGNQCNVHDAAVLRLRRYAGRMYLVIKPTVRGTDMKGAELPPHVAKELKRAVLTRQWNSQFSDALSGWLRLLFPQSSNRYEFPLNAASFAFSVRRQTMLARIRRPKPNFNVPRSLTELPQCVFDGSRLDEPKLRFSNRNGDGFATDTHPIRGVLRNQPYDHALTTRNIVREVRLGIVCPAADTTSLSRYLAGLHSTQRATSRKEYVLDYPGFSQAFGIAIDIPVPGGPSWQTCHEPTLDVEAVPGSQDLRQGIIAAISALQAAANPSVVVIYVPARWSLWEKYSTDQEYFDLHDFIKAYCVQRGISTQFLREETLAKSNRGEVLWWLALSFYTKSMLTPWVLDPLDRNTAYMGLGYSIDPLAGKGQHITLGCSHIYSADGKGLRYRLRKLDDVAFDRQGNPFMSRDDARRLGESVRQLFYESMGELPRRVVIHKRTYFRPDEKEGLLEGLGGIGAIDMLEVNIDEMLRYTAARVGRDGKLESDMFPVRRGTTVVLDRRRALLWVHGTAESLDPQRPNFYLGKSRIPAPLVLIRHHGQSELSVLAQEVLGLSKMNWNTFDMYTKVPATIQSSNAIARIGVLLERFEPNSYDYRLFI